MGTASTHCNVFRQIVTMLGIIASESIEYCTVTISAECLSWISSAERLEETLNSVTCEGRVQGASGEMWCFRFEL